MPLQSKIIKIYLNSIESTQTSLTTLFGAISGLSELGNEVCQSFIIPLVKVVGERISQLLDSSTQENLSGEKVKQQVVKILAAYYRTKYKNNNNNNNQNSDDQLDKIVDEIGSYFGPLVFSNLLKLRNERVNALVQAQITSVNNVL
jgi:transcription initiation factor TFIID subunit 6